MVFMVVLHNRVPWGGSTEQASLSQWEDTASGYVCESKETKIHVKQQF